MNSNLAAVILFALIFAGSSGCVHRAGTPSVTRYQIASLPVNERDVAASELKKIIISDMNMSLSNAKQIMHIGSRSKRVIEHAMAMYRHNPGNYVTSIGDLIEFSDGQLIPIPSRNMILMIDPDYFSTFKYEVHAYKDDGTNGYFDLEFSTKDSARIFFEALEQLSELK